LREGGCLIQGELHTVAPGDGLVGSELIDERLTDGRGDPTSVAATLPFCVGRRYQPRRLGRLFGGGGHGGDGFEGVDVDEAQSCVAGCSQR
jgi:hypothetical protein